MTKMNLFPKLCDSLMLSFFYVEEPIGDEESQRFDSPNERFFAFAQNDKERTSPIPLIKKSLNLGCLIIVIWCFFF